LDINLINGVQATILPTHAGKKSAERYGTTFRCPSVCHPMAQIVLIVELFFKLTYTRKNCFRQAVGSR
jgi:hypothetical protein